MFEGKRRSNEPSFSDVMKEATKAERSRQEQDRTEKADAKKRLEERVEEIDFSKSAEELATEDIRKMKERGFTHIEMEFLGAWSYCMAKEMPGLRSGAPPGTRYYPLDSDYARTLVVEQYKKWKADHEKRGTARKDGIGDTREPAEGEMHEEM